MRFSIIIPAYNTADYIERCLNSVLSQPFFDYELILVDDGSADKTGEICDAYARRHPQMQVFHVPHGGLGYARNIGTQHARGDYILYLDSDDYIAPDSLGALAADIDGEDLYLLRSQKVSRGQILEPLRRVEAPAEAEFEAVLYQLVQEETLFCSPCDKAISRSFLAQNGIVFPESRRNEDILWVLQIIASVKSVGISNCPYYFYEQHRPGSLSRSFSEDNVRDVVLSLKEGIARCAQTPAPRKATMESFLSVQFAWILPYLPMYSDALSCRQMCDLVRLLKAHPTQKWLYYFISLFGLGTVSRVMKYKLKGKYAVATFKKRCRRHDTHASNSV